MSADMFFLVESVAFDEDASSIPAGEVFSAVGAAIGLPTEVSCTMHSTFMLTVTGLYLAWAWRW